MLALLFISLLLALSHAVEEGAVLSLRRLNGALEVQRYPVPTGSSVVPVQKYHKLEGDLSGFSLSCGSCDDGRQVLEFDEGKIVLHVVLSDSSLSLLQTNVSGSDTAESKPVQVVGLSEYCVPLHLMPFSYSSSDFAVVCRDLGAQLATITPDRRIALQEYNPGPNEPGVLVESDSQLFSVVVIDERRYSKRSYHSGNPETLYLPDNIKCIGGENKLFPFNGQDKFLLQCQTVDGPTLYIVPLAQGETARALLASGHPYSSIDGSYISMVNGTTVVSYVSANESVVPVREDFPSKIVEFEFLNSNSARVITEDSKHYLMDLSNGRSGRRSMPGGSATKWIWISTANIYLYVTEGGELFAFEGMSEKPDARFPKMLASQPQILLYVIKCHQQPIPTVHPTSTSTSTSTPEPTTNPINEPTFKGDDTPISTIAGSVVGVLVGLLLAGVVVVVIGGYIVRQWNRQRQPRNYIHMPIEETHVLEEKSVQIGEQDPRKFETQPVAASNPSGTSQIVMDTSPPTLTLVTTSQVTTTDVSPATASNQSAKESSEERNVPIPALNQDIPPPGVVEKGNQSTATPPKAQTTPTSPGGVPNIPLMTEQQNTDYILPFREYPSNHRDPDTASSAYAKHVEEPSYPDHVNTTSS